MDFLFYIALFFRILWMVPIYAVNAVRKKSYKSLCISDKMHKY